MQDHKLDFHSTFRKLSSFRPSLLNLAGDSPLEKFIKELLSLSPGTDTMDPARATADWLAWLRKYAGRIESEREEWAGETDVEAAKEKAAKEANPRFVLRQWVLEEVIAKVESDAKTGKRLLAKVLQVNTVYSSHAQVLLTLAQNRWHVTHSSLGVPRNLMTHLMLKHRKKGGIVGWARRRCWVSSVAAQAKGGSLIYKAESFLNYDKFTSIYIQTRCETC
jgi:uncharacterized protein YdiU (UPF0061 family)